MPRWKHIHDLDNPGDIYLSRLMLIKTRWFGVYLHVIRRPDWAECEHDHPWAFSTLILRGGYEEEIDGVKRVRRPGYFGYRPMGFAHRIVRLLKGNAVTLVFRGPDHVEWGFWNTRGKRLTWETYAALTKGLRVLWCDDRAEGAAR